MIKSNQDTTTTRAPYWYYHVGTALGVVALALKFLKEDEIKEFLPDVWRKRLIAGLFVLAAMLIGYGLLSQLVKRIRFRKKTNTDLTTSPATFSTADIVEVIRKKIEISNSLRAFVASRFYGQDFEHCVKQAVSIGIGPQLRSMVFDAWFSADRLWPSTSKTFASLFSKETDHCILWFLYKLRGVATGLCEKNFSDRIRVDRLMWALGAIQSHTGDCCDALTRVEILSISGLLDMLPAWPICTNIRKNIATAIAKIDSQGPGGIFWSDKPLPYKTAIDSFIPDLSPPFKMGHVIPLKRGTTATKDGFPLLVEIEFSLLNEKPVDIDRYGMNWAADEVIFMVPPVFAEPLQPKTISVKRDSARTAIFMLKSISPPGLGRIAVKSENVESTSDWFEIMFAKEVPTEEILGGGVNSSPMLDSSDQS